MVWSRLASKLRGRRPPGPDPDAPVRRVPDDRIVYAIGDIHGRADLLSKLLDKIMTHAAMQTVTDRVVVCLGDYVDRGSDSRGVIDVLLDRHLPATTLVCLRGNHEQLMLDFLADPAAIGPMWLRNGGLETLASYGVGFDPTAPRLAALETAGVRLAHQVPMRHKAFLNDLKLTHEEGDYLFVHAGLAPNVPLEEQKESDLLWMRDPFLEEPPDYGCMVVHGHTITAEPEWRAWRIGIDTGAFSSGRLTALALIGERQEVIQAVG